jgi:hypothetical protein
MDTMLNLGKEAKLLPQNRKQRDIGGAGLYLEDLVFVGLSSQTQPIEKHPSSIERAESPLLYAPVPFFFATCVMR